MVGLVALIVWLVRNANRSGFPNGSRESPLDILKTRYAKGEITKEQFDAIKRDLGA
jgi:putative membrane protein